MSKKIRWGILGCGKIARKLASDLKYVRDAELVAVGSRYQQTADEFADEFSVKYRHSSYQSLVQNDEIDVIYIATPHVFHHEHTLLCLENGKAVLCEKPFAMNVHQVQEMIGLAKRKNVFLMEAFWTKFLPHFNKTERVIHDGLIGEIKSIQADFGFQAVFEPSNRLYNPNLGGGSLLDIGIYPVFLAVHFLGKPDKINAVMTPTPTGVDEQCSIVLEYNNQVLVQLFSTIASFTATEAFINGSKGRLHLTSRFYSPTATIQYYLDKPETKKEVFAETIEGFGYQYEAQHVVECLQKGLKESPVMKFSDSLLLIETLDEIRKKIGLKYKADQS